MKKRILYSLLLCSVLNLLPACQNYNSNPRAQLEEREDEPLLEIRKPLIYPKHAINYLLPPAALTPLAQQNPVSYLPSSNPHLVHPPVQFMQPAPTAPIGFVGEDEDAKDLRMSKKEYLTPSKKSLFSSHKADKNTVR